MRWPAGPTSPVSGLLPPQRERVLVVVPALQPADPWLSLQMHSIRNLPPTRFREQHREDGVEDMTQLE